MEFNLGLSLLFFSQVGRIEEHICQATAQHAQGVYCPTGYG